MIIPYSAIPYIKMQRTELKKISDGEAVLDEYRKMIHKDYRDICTSLGPLSDSSFVCDIGCGMAGIDVEISLMNNPSFILVDGSGFQPRYGFKDDTAFYNDKQILGQFMSVNNVRHEIFNASSGKDLPVFSPKIDVIISLLSCGYHYPVETYLEWIKSNLSPAGRLIIDLRHSTDQLKVIKESFKNVNVISEKNKSTRVCAWQVL